MSADESGVQGRLCSCAHPIVDQEPDEAPICVKCGRSLDAGRVLHLSSPSRAEENRFGAPPADRRPEPAASRQERDTPPPPRAVPRIAPALGQAGSGPSFDWPFDPSRPIAGSDERRAKQ